MEKPSKLWSFLKLCFAAPNALLFFLVLTGMGYEGAGVCLVFGFLFGLMVRLALVGLAGMGGRRLPGRLSWGLVLGLAILCAAIGPPFSSWLQRDAEETKWKAIQASTRLQDWLDYEKKIAEPFRRADYRPRLFVARIKDAAASQDVAKLRTVVKVIRDHHADDKAFQPALDEATADLKQLYTAALASMSRKGADARLQSAFRTVLDDMAAHQDGTVYVLFRNQADLKPLPSSNQLLASMRQSPELRKAFPKGDAPVLGEGEAFSQSFDMKRRDSFMKAAQESFSKVFPQQGLFQLEPLPAGKDGKGSLVFLVNSHISRTPTYFIHTHGDDKKVVGLLFGIQVEWSFAVVDRSGKQLYSSKTRSEPAKSLRFQVQSTDPPWAPYSVMMDSAYSNYARETVSRFGIEPPAEKAYFEFSK